MMDRFAALVVEIRTHFGIADAFDILLVSVLLYSLLLWFKATASRRVLIGLFVLAGVYIVARVFDMYLTSLMFQAGLAVVLVVVVVVFQEDLRRMLEGVTNWRWIRALRSSEWATLNVDALVDTVFSMSAQRTGALIVIRGAEPVARHLDGGIAVGGEISKPLLLSIFDESSPGHDGAVVIQKGRIDSFAAHLPISKNQAEIAGRGTRHSAALGLSECCDALVIVVSEERGSVGVAERGALTEVRSAAALKGRIARFEEEKHPLGPAQTPWRQFIARDWHLKAAALVLAIGAWFAFAYNPDTVQRNFVVPIQYRNLASTLALNEDAPHEARVTLSGSERDFRFLEPAELRLTIDLAQARTGLHEFDLSIANMRLPTNLDVYGISPRTVRLFISTQGPPSVADPTKTSRN